MSDTLKKISRAKAMLVIEQPFIASIVCGIPLMEDATLNPPTMATDGKNVWFHPAFVAAHTERQIMWALGHETLHCVMKHMLRRGERDPKKWNWACDYAINGLLENDLPRLRMSWTLFDPKLYADGKGQAETIYNLMPDDYDKGGGGSPGDGSGHGAFDEIRDMPGSPAERAEEEAVWSVRVAQAAAAAKACGKFGPHMQQFVDQMLNPKVPWEMVLRRFCTRPVRDQRSYARPARRHLWRGDYLPGRSGVGMGDIMVAVDLSGSISQTELNRFVAELRGIKEDANPANIHVVYFSHYVSKHEVFSADEELDIHPEGGGGTAFSPIWAFAEANSIQPECCVVLTDLCCSDFGDHPDYPVLWVTTGATEAPWGEVTSIRD